MSNLSPQGPLNQLANAAAMLVIVMFLLWLAVWLLQQIWLWLLILLGVTALFGGAVWLVRWRRNRF